MSIEREKILIPSGLADIAGRGHALLATPRDTRPSSGPQELKHLGTGEPAIEPHQERGRRKAALLPA